MAEGMGEDMAESVASGSQSLNLDETSSDNPIALLEQITSKRNIKPLFELVDFEARSPVFRCKVTVGKLCAYGTAYSKNDAKHAAAKAVLNVLMSYPEKESCSHNHLTHNYVMLMQELCHFNNWPLPTYQMYGERIVPDTDGGPHVSKFRVACKLFCHFVVGEGKCNNTAKHNAASKMYTIIKEVSNKSSDAIEKFSRHHFADLKDYDYSVQNGKIITVSQFIKGLKQSKGPYLTHLMSTPLKNQYECSAKLLQDISVAQCFDLEYQQLPDRIIPGQYRCILRISQVPLVFNGSGWSKSAATNEAASNCLKYLKLALK